MKGSRATESQQNTTECPVHFHPEDYMPTAADLQDVLAGRSYYMKGDIYAAQRYICTEITRTECMWFLGVPADADFPMIDTLVFPEQLVTGVSCEVQPEQIRLCQAAANLDGRNLCYGKHTHAPMGAWQSHQDGIARRDQMEMQCVVRGTELVRVPAGEPVCATPSSGSRSCVTGFELPGLNARALVEGVPGTALSMELLLRREVHVTGFATTNMRHEESCACLVRRFCPCQCGSFVDDIVDTTLHVVGDVAMSDEQRTTLQEEMDTKLRTGTGVHVVSGWGGSATTSPVGVTWKEAVSSPVYASSVAPVNRTYDLYWGANYVGSMDLDVLKHAIEAVPELRQGLLMNLPEMRGLR